MENPKIDPEVCTGCGICVDICPTGAIELNDVAKIIVDKCSNCRDCIDECPVEAIG